MSTNPGNWQHSEEYSRAAESFLPAPDLSNPEKLDGQDVRGDFRGDVASAKPMAWPRAEAAAELDDAPGSFSGANPDTARAASAKPLAARLLQLLIAAWWRIWAKIETRRAEHGRRSLRVVETVPLGEKRFVAIVQVQEARFLIGGGSAGVSLLARLDSEQPFAAVLEEQAAPLASVAATRIREAW